MEIGWLITRFEATHRKEGKTVVVIVVWPFKLIR